MTALSPAYIPLLAIAGTVILFFVGRLWDKRDRTGTEGLNLQKAAIEAFAPLLEESRLNMKDFKDAAVAAGTEARAAREEASEARRQLTENSRMLAQAQEAASTAQRVASEALSGRAQAEADRNDLREKLGRALTRIDALEAQVSQLSHENAALMGGAMHLDPLHRDGEGEAPARTHPRRKKVDLIETNPETTEGGESV